MVARKISRREGTPMTKLASAFIITLVLLAQLATAQGTTPLTSEELNRRTIQRRAVDAVIWAYRS
jgi:hypothetical protein